MDLLARYDAPILAGTLKLWLLELNPPLCTWDSWDDVKKIYPQGDIFLIYVSLYSDFNVF